ncbi:hypothetical protein PAXRUDRAFT_409801 [Paxillus rubicundulus Ve08.2h10]|uniref:Uncharacterized protein n=1 Tax=Paxillus rubicundulus Ve08.2h10 TaxID=930991 RepID=A0A0D0E8M1_9AGAM|nr:hypothetical protein PAXRUDRAFT_409801 [Paxillus rubicundulus Ve08.2h10]
MSHWVSMIGLQCKTCIPLRSVTGRPHRIAGWTFLSCRKMHQVLAFVTKIQLELQTSQNKLDVFRADHWLSSIMGGQLRCKPSRRHCARDNPSYIIKLYNATSSHRLACGKGK